jgi:hypothetical protein
MVCLGATAMVLGGARPKRLVLGVLAAVTLAAVAVVLWATTGPAEGVRVVQSPPSGGDGNQARTYALRLLAQLRLPDEARQATWPAQPDRLAQPTFENWSTYAVTAQALYRDAASTESVDQFLTTHVPVGMRLRWSYPPYIGNARNVLDVPAHLPSGIEHASLAVVVIPRGSGSLMNVEVQVVWYPLRTAVEYVYPDRYRSVTVTVPVISTTSPGATVTRTFTSRSVIEQFATLLNRLPGMPPTGFMCPMMTSGPPPSPYRIVFTPESRRWPMIAASPVGCDVGGVVAGGLKQPALDFSHDKIMPTMLSVMGQSAK